MTNIVSLRNADTKNIDRVIYGTDMLISDMKLPNWCPNADAPPSTTQATLNAVSRLPFGHEQHEGVLVAVLFMRAFHGNVDCAIGFVEYLLGSTLEDVTVGKRKLPNGSAISYATVKMSSDTNVGAASYNSESHVNNPAKNLLDCVLRVYRASLTKLTSK